MYNQKYLILQAQNRGHVTGPALPPWQAKLRYPARAAAGANGSTVTTFLGVKNGNTTGVGVIRVDFRLECLGS